MSRGFLRKSSVNTFIGIVWILFAVGTSAQNAVSKFRADSIRQSLSRIQKPQDKIPLLKINRLVLAIAGGGTSVERDNRYRDAFGFHRDRIRCDGWLESLLPCY